MRHEGEPGPSAALPGPCPTARPGHGLSPTGYDILTLGAQDIGNQGRVPGRWHFGASALTRMNPLSHGPCAAHPWRTDRQKPSKLPRPPPLMTRRMLPDGYLMRQNRRRRPAPSARCTFRRSLSVTPDRDGTYREGGRIRPTSRGSHRSLSALLPAMPGDSQLRADVPARRPPRGPGTGTRYLPAGAPTNLGLDSHTRNDSTHIHVTRCPFFLCSRTSIYM